MNHALPIIQHSIRNSALIVAVGADEVHVGDGADQAWIFARKRLLKAMHLRGIIDGNTDDLQPARAVLALQGVEHGDLPSTRLTPACPKVDEHDPSIPLLDRMAPAVQIRQAEDG